MFGRDGKLSVIRLGTIAAVIGILLIVAAVAAVYIDRTSHQVPLDVEVYKGAIAWGAPRQLSVSARSVVYQIQGATPEQVVAFYQSKLNEFNGNSEESCQRSPSQGNFLEFEKGNTEVVPFQFSCMFDRSGLGVSQYTRVNIQPGIKSMKTEGMTIVEYEQHWQP
jgi:hypothetical protein